VLKDFFEYAQDARMLLIADKPPNGLEVPHGRIDYVKWSEENEVSLVQKMDVGLMPLADNLWTRGKCSFKMLQYMACGKPVVASPVGMNAEILTIGNVGFGPHDEKGWLEALVYLYDNCSKALLLGQNGRELTERCFSLKAVSGMLAEVFQNVA
jgi:glycosyltransferase involved in cell wall biosynthesis